MAGLGLSAPVPFYYLCLAVAALAHWAVSHLVRTPFGLALQGVRDNPQRLRDVGLLRVLAFALDARHRPGGPAGRPRRRRDLRLRQLCR